MFDKHDVTTKKLDVIVEKAGKVDANYAAQIEGYCSLLGEYGKKFETVCAMLALDLIGVIPVIGALKYSDEIGTLFKNADKVSVVARSTDGTGVLARHADEAGAWLQGVKVFRYSDETAEAVASGEKLLKESGTIYESFADMMSPDDAAKYLDFLENGSKEGLTSAELAGVEKADALLVSQKVECEDVWDLRNVGDLLESGSKGGRYSGDLMSAEEAAKYSEHWRELGIGSDKTWNEFKNANPNATIDDYFKLVNEQSPWPDGYNPKDHMIKLKEGDTFNMVLDKKQKVSQPGGFGIVNDVPNREFARNDMAIKLDWKDDCGKIATYRVKSGKELNVPSGPIGPQIDLKADKYLPGNTGITQLDLFNGLGRINRTDYIEAVPGSVRRLN